MSNRNSDSTGHKSDVGNRTSIGNSSQRQQPAKTGPSTTSSTSPANRNTTSTAPKATKPSFSAAAGGKPPAHVPVRTNSAPPEEHPGDAPKSHFVPTKTTSQMTGVTSEHSYRSALGVKTESNDQKPKAAPEQPQEKVQPQPEPQPEKVATSQPPAQPEVTTPVINDTTGQAISNDPSATVSAENLEKSPQFNRDGDQREYRNSTRGTRDPNTQRRTDRSGSWGGNGSMGNNRAPRNNQANTQPQQQQQQQQQLQQQQYVAYQQQPTQYTPQQMYYLQQQQQQTQQFYAQYGSLLTLPQQQFQAYLVQYFTPDQHSFWWQHWQAYQTLRQQQQQYYMYYGQAYQQVPQYYQAGGVAVQGYPYAYSASQMPATTANVAYTNVPSTGKYPEDNTPQVAPPAVATNPVVQSSPVVNTTPVVTTSTPSQTPVVAAKPEPEVPPPAIDIPPTQEEVKPKIEIPTKRKGPVIKTKEGVEVDLSKLKSAPVPKPSQPVAEQATESQEKADSDKPTEVQVTEESTKVEEIKVETAPIASTPSVEQVIPDLPVEVARPKKARAPTIDEPSPVKEIDQPSFPVEKPVKEEASLAPPGLKKEVQAENWEEADTSAQGPAPVADQPGLGRRLVQGNKLSHAHGKLAQPVSKKVYTKQEIFALRPDGEFNRSLLGSINYVADGGASSGHGKGGGNYPRGGRGGVSGGREGREGRGGNYGGDLTPTSTGEAPGWTREALPPLQTGGHGGKKGKQPASPVPPPKKKELDPIEVLANEAMLILNQIAPKTFDLFCQKLLDLSLKNTAMLDKIVELIFEKAIYDTAFVEMYAELCLQLKERSAWTFFTIVKVEEGEFFWIRDFTFPEEAAGPYYSRQDALNVFNPSVTAEIPVMKPSSISPSNIKQQEILLSKTHFLKIVQKNEGEWFVTYVPESAVPVEQRSQSLFTSDKEASKDAVTELSFRGRLAHSCEIEFQKSVKDESLFEAVDEEYKQLRAKRATISQDEYEIQEADILERRTKIKRRMLANIRFVGELYKKKLLNTETMHDCIVELLGHPPNWKQLYDEEDLELLCDLLSTVGETLETKTKKLKNKEKSDYVKKFDQYFEKLKLLSKDRNLISRIRFRIEAVVDLRSNNWVKRTGPITTAPAEPAQKEDRPVSQRSAPSASSSSNAPRILSRQEGPSGGDRYGGNSGRPSSQRDPYERDNRGGREDNRGSGRYGAPAGGSYDERDYNRGGGRGGGDDRRYRNNEPPARQAAPPSSAGSGKFAPPSTTAVPTEEAVDKLQFDSESKVRKGVESSVDEVLSGIEVGELTATLKESSFLHTGFFIQILLDKYSNSSSAKARDTLLAILDDGELSSWLVTNRPVVEKAVEQYAPLLQLVDTSVDILQAPELLGTVVGRLVKGNAINRGAIEKMVGKWTQFNIDDMGCPPEDVEKVFNRFLSKLL